MLTHGHLYKALIEWMKVANEITKGYEPPVFPELSDIREKSNKCFIALQRSKSGILRQCRNFCSYFNLNARSPIMEGNIDFVHEVI